MSVKDLLNDKPCLHSHCTATASTIRTEPWMIIKNPMTAQHVRVHQNLWESVLQLDGTCTVRQWIQRNMQIFDERQLLAVLMQLQNADMVSCNADPVDHRAISAGYLVRFNPLSVRVALFNPTGFLDVLCWLRAGISTRILSGLYGFIVLSALYVLSVSWVDIVHFWEGFEARSQVWWIVFLYPLTKCLHELAHGLALRRRGGEVPEAGVSFLVLFPLPYVDATDSWTLSRKDRMHVTAAGMLIDMLLACIGLLLWYVLDSGVLANLAFTLVLLGIASIVLFNANPLLKFDGYYLLEDALDAPGLARRSLAYYRHIFKRFVLLLKNDKPPLVARGERRWLLLYGFFFTTYRFFIVAVISRYLIETLHEVGFILSLFAIIPLCVLPVYRFTHYLMLSDELAEKRGGSVALICVLLMATAAFLATVPFPSSTKAHGVVWVDQQAEIYAKQTGVIDSFLVEDGNAVIKDQPIIKLDSPELVHEKDRKRAAIEIANIEVARYRQNDIAQARTSMMRVRLLETELEDIENKIDNLVVRAPESGKLALEKHQAILGAYIEQGDLLAYVVDNDERVVRAVVNQASMGELEKGVADAYVRFPHAMTMRIKAEITKQVPSGNYQLPSVALANVGFGGLAIKAGVNGQPVQTLEKVFHLELTLFPEERGLQNIPMGTRAYVTLEHEPEPLGSRWMRISRRLLLQHLNV